MAKRQSSRVNVANIRVGNKSAVKDDEIGIEFTGKLKLVLDKTAIYGAGENIKRAMLQQAKNDWTNTIQNLNIDDKEVNWVNL